MKDLTIEDLELGDLTLADLEAPTKPQPTPREKLLAHLESRRPVWIVSAKVLVIDHTHCACGAEYRAPGSRGLLVRFISKTTTEIQELSDHPAVQNPNLPLVHRVLVKRVNVCVACAHGA